MRFSDNMVQTELISASLRLKVRLFKLVDLPGNLTYFTPQFANDTYPTFETQSWSRH